MELNTFNPDGNPLIAHTHESGLIFFFEGLHSPSY